VTLFKSVINIDYVSLRIPDKAIKPLQEEAFERERILLKRKLQFYEEQIKSFERKHKMTSEEFRKRFNSGELGDDKIWFEWLFALKVYTHIKERLSALEGVELGQEIPEEA